MDEEEGGEYCLLVMVISSEVATELTSTLTSSLSFFCLPILHSSVVKVGIGRMEELFSSSY